eukprot:TRINITY_DN6012_c0_g1_i1.p1 TRINITY_DN6012_c0_g1~~TRINITY_DN6012_c0_g1_i1.p1  ORF type:complete len:277 (-),score=41.34 TRINITY_DN6012_c0_g1_i1:130-960(-)
MKISVFFAAVSVQLAAAAKIRAGDSSTTEPLAGAKHPELVGVLGQPLRGPLFVHIPKTAGSSIWAALGSNYADSSRYKEVPFFCVKHNPPAEHVKDSWAVVRDPCERLQSEFNWVRGVATFYEFAQDGVDVYKKPADCGVFNSWVSAVIKRYQNSSEIEDCHMIPQWCYASKVDKLLPMDSKLEQRIRDMDERLSNIKLPVINRGLEYEKRGITCDCLTPENLKLVQNHFFDDFKHLSETLGWSKWAPAEAKDPQAPERPSSCKVFYRSGKKYWPN